jgi:hypothetical protein
MCIEGRIQEAENSRSQGGQDVTRLMCLFRESQSREIAKSNQQSATKRRHTFLNSWLLGFLNSPRFTPRSSPRARRYSLVHLLPGARQRSGTVDQVLVGSFRPLEAPERLAETRQ